MLDVAPEMKSCITGLSNFGCSPEFITNYHSISPQFRPYTPHPIYLSNFDGQISLDFYSLSPFFYILSLTPISPNLFTALRVYSHGTSVLTPALIFIFTIGKNTFILICKIHTKHQHQSQYWHKKSTGPIQKRQSLSSLAVNTA